jgi:hypothetical protein
MDSSSDKIDSEKRPIGDDGPWEWVMIYVHALAIIIIGSFIFLPVWGFVKTFFPLFYRANLSVLEKDPHTILCCIALSGIVFWTPIYLYIRKRYFKERPSENIHKFDNT